MKTDFLGNLNFILGDAKLIQKDRIQLMQRVDRNTILKSAMFWDSKQRIQRIKTLFLNGLGLKQFDDNDDFKVQQLENIQLLNLSKNQIIHLQPLKCLTTLVSLNISSNKVYDLNSLSDLTNLEQIYASNNQIKSIEAVKTLKCLRVLQMYNNKISHFKQTFQALTSLTSLSELDIQKNPISEDNEFVELVSSSFQNLKRINNELNKSSKKIKQLSSSKAFINTSMKSFNTTTAFFNNYSKPMDANMSIYDFCKKKASNSKGFQRLIQKQNILNKLEAHYDEIDEDFQKQIVKNVRLKNRLYKIIQNKRINQISKEQINDKRQQLVLLKRKVKCMKEQLFTKDRKGELLRKLFQIEVTSKQSEGEQIDKSGNAIKQKNNKQTLQLHKLQNQIKWTRKFECDETIVIQRDNTYLLDQEEEMSEMLGNIQNTLTELRSEMDYLT